MGKLRYASGLFSTCEGVWSETLRLGINFRGSGSKDLAQVDSEVDTRKGAGLVDSANDVPRGSALQRPPEEGRTVHHFFGAEHSFRQGIVVRHVFMFAMDRELVDVGDDEPCGLAYGVPSWPTFGERLRLT
jgi:hypothetical protein